MITWERVRLRGVCGLCSRELVTNDPIKVYTFATSGPRPARLIRCDGCDGPAPADLPLLVEGAIGVMGPPIVVKTWAELEGNRREREPGEEG